MFGYSKCFDGDGKGRDISRTVVILSTKVQKVLVCVLWSKICLGVLSVKHSFIFSNCWSAAELRGQQLSGLSPVTIVM